MPAFTSQLQELRQQLPIGIRHALHLLARTQGDVAAAAQLFRQELTDVVVGHTAVAPAVAQQHLAQAHYDVSRALESIRAERFTLTERILARYSTNKPEALDHVRLAVEGHTPLVHTYWLEASELDKLNPPQACFLLLHEWVAYQEWEDLASALYFHLDLVVAQLRQQLQQPALAATLLAMRERHSALRTRYATASFEKAHKRISSDQRLRDYKAEFEQLKPLLLDRLHHYVQEHIGSFP